MKPIFIRLLFVLPVFFLTTGWEFSFKPKPVPGENIYTATNLADLAGTGLAYSNDQFNVTASGGGSDDIYSNTNLADLAGTGLAYSNDQFNVTASGATTFEELTGNRFVLGNNNLAGIATNALGAFQAGPISGSATIGTNAYGASQQGRLIGALTTIGEGAYGASQHGYLFGTTKIGENAYGASQRGLIAFNSKATIGNNAVGAMQFGFVPLGSTATNNGVGAIQLMGTETSANYYTTSSADGSILLGPGTNDVKYSVKAAGGFDGPSIRFDTTNTNTPDEGELEWYEPHANLGYGLPGSDYVADVNPSIIRVQNDWTNTITAGTVVSRSGQLGSARPRVRPFQEGDRPLGVAVEDITSTGDTSGYILTQGLLFLDTTGLGTGCLYAADSGVLTNVPPAPPVDVWRIGCVVVSGNDGKILVNITPTKSYSALDARYIKPRAMALTFQHSNHNPAGVTPTTYFFDFTADLGPSSASSASARQFEFGFDGEIIGANIATKVGGSVSTSTNTPTVFGVYNKTLNTYHPVITNDVNAYNASIDSASSHSISVSINATNEYAAYYQTFGFPDPPTTVRHAFTIYVEKN